MSDASYTEITFHSASSLDTSKCYNILKINYPIYYTHILQLHNFGSEGPAYQGYKYHVATGITLFSHHICFDQTYDVAVTHLSVNWQSLAEVINM
jgi:hypothetical protein